MLASYLVSSACETLPSKIGAIVCSSPVSTGPLARLRIASTMIRDHPAISDTDSAGCGSAQADTQDHHVAARNGELGLADPGYRAPEKLDQHTVVRDRCPGCNHHPVDPGIAGSAGSGTVDFAVADNKVAPVAGSAW